MCLTTTLFDLGPADAVLDLDENLIVLRPSNTPAERLQAARTLLARNGIRQSVPGVATCLCGDVLFAGPSPCGPRIMGLVAATAAVIAAAVVTLVPQSIGAAVADTPDPATTVTRTAETMP